MRYLKKYNEEFGFDALKNRTNDNLLKDNEAEDFEYTEDGVDYELPYEKIDKMLPSDPELQKEYYEIIDSEEEITTKYSDMEEFFVNNIQEDKFYSYCEDGNLKNFAIYVVQRELNIEE